MSETENGPEQDLEALQDHSDRLGEEISEAREDWESKKADPAVPGADGDSAAAQPEDLPADEQLDPQDPENEDL